MTTSAALHPAKAAIMLALGGVTTYSAQAGEPSWVSYGVGGTLAAVMFYFYRQLVAESRDRERQNAESYARQAATVLEVVQHDIAATTEMRLAVHSLQETVTRVNLEAAARERAAILGRRKYDPKVDGEG